VRKQLKTLTTESTTQKVLTRRDVQKALRKANLTREEELCLRMRLGITESPAAKLSFRGQQSDELATKLAQIEADALGRLRPRAAVQTAPEGETLKAAIVEKLKRI
jgi:DNA-directed RNA polymerase sigma subunit (sigma70/sigma32)